MMFWSKNKPETSIIYDKLDLKVKELELRIDDLEQKFRSLRGLVNKKLYDDDETSVKEDVKPKKAEDLSSLVPKFL